MLNVNIGGTKNRDKIREPIRSAWKVLDVAGEPDYRYDLNSGEPLPFGDGTVDNYYSSETLEHVRPEVLAHVFAEMRRTLKAGGLLRVVVPDIRLAASKYVADDTAWLKKHVQVMRTYPDTNLGLLMSLFYSHTKHGPDAPRTGHRAAFDMETMHWYLSKAGFKDIRTSQYNAGSQVFTGLDLPRYRTTGLYMEARK